jgi:hypothetical protein
VTKQNRKNLFEKTRPDQSGSMRKKKIKYYVDNTPNLRNGLHLNEEDV